MFGTDAGAFDWVTTDQILELGLLAELTSSSNPWQEAWRWRPDETPVL